MPTEEWHADIEVTEALVRQCICEQFKELTPLKTVACIGEGWDNKVFLVNDTIIFRFPRRTVAIDLIERENTVLTYLQSKITIDVPNPLYIGQASDIYPYPFHGYPMLVGVSGCHAGLNTEQRAKSIIPLAKFLKELHSIDETQAKAIGTNAQPFDSSNKTEAFNYLTERVDKLIARKICSINLSCLQDEISKAQQVELPVTDKVLVHGDLYCRHLLFKQHQLTGVIDWGDVGINNRSIDLAVIFNFYPSETHQTFLDIYGEVESNTWQYARFLGLYLALTILLYGETIGDTLLVAQAKRAIEWINPEIITT